MPGPKTQAILEALRRLVLAHGDMLERTPLRLVQCGLRFSEASPSTPRTAHLSVEAMEMGLRNGSPVSESS